MNANPLFTEDKSDVVAYFCSECRYVKSREEDAEKCCRPQTCKCGSSVELHTSLCRPCIAKFDDERLRRKLSKATRVKEPTNDFVFTEEVDENDGYFKFDDIETVFGESDKPLFVYDCDQVTWAGLDTDDLIECALEAGDWHEDAIEDVIAKDELKELIEAWNKKQNLTQYESVGTRIIVLDQKAFDAWMAMSPIKPINKS